MHTLKRGEMKKLHPAIKKNKLNAFMVLAEGGHAAVFRPEHI